MTSYAVIGILVLALVIGGGYYLSRKNKGSGGSGPQGGKHPPRSFPK